MANRRPEDLSPYVILYRRTGSSLTYAIRGFLHCCGVAFDWVEVSSGEIARKIGLENSRDLRLPVYIFRDGTWINKSAIRHIWPE